MTLQWTSEQLDKFTSADDLHVSPFYADGKTYGTPTWIWSVVVDNDIYVRAYNGQNSRWYQSAMAQGAGKIKIAGEEFEVNFIDAAGSNELDLKINAAYQKKYQDSPYLPPMLQAGPVSATVKILPR
ncbi:DUF2255 family protein [Weissella thailandensis]|uniref:DUF2255 family protein n=1 Tax=Weissella thailandensis TaxID=89061 RepID=A0ABX9I3A6_9LACO|nr:DUF2255 family protein [Weissella thailandensis]NKY91425.1 DUF2255 family protein [Weissella thailandensis]RDS59072.1 DUF2255 family protein [Weissella thailandensis]GEP75572.1 hypothetical protein WTH01_18190 [Weissella thailandensis]